MFLFVLAKLLPKSHNLYGNSLDFKLKIYERKNQGQNHVEDHIALADTSFLRNIAKGTTDSRVKFKHKS